ncbi:hypothetical protein PG995_012749 [Apiospora arundinis]|uniref:Fungal-specific transcription factor domain-containing protein n=1 Tax=Apiospora arundinis TaxID=335852 RepID=A0ABR2I5B2_9PEZI
MTSMPSGKPPRVLACVLCQHRKIKCDRHSPCSNCTKAGVTCTPSTPAPARKRRRPNHDLQQRLARCEELLQEYATAKPAGPASGPAPDEKGIRPVGKLIHGDSGPRFMNSFMWAEVYDELRAMREIMDNDVGDDESCSTPADGQTPDHNNGLLFSEGMDVSLEDLHPDPAHVFGLWQTFLERVNPLTKVIHVPSVQPFLVEAATKRDTLPKKVEALMFSIYVLGATALSPQESLALLGYSRDEAITRFSRGCRLAFMRIQIFKQYDLITLQALVLYQHSLGGHYDRNAAWILNGTIVRIAQIMGLHRDGEALGLSPFDAEMRRRIWWQIVLLDASYALMSGLGQSMVPRSWDTKKPANLTDSDLFPTMTKVESRPGPTDMVYCMSCYEIAQLLVDFPSLDEVMFQNETGVESLPPAVFEQARIRVDQLDAKLAEILAQYCDVTMGPVHILAKETRPDIIGKLREMICPPQSQPEWGSEVFSAKDNLFKISVSSAEHTIRLYNIIEMVDVGTKFQWFIKAHFQVEVFQYMIGQLMNRISGPLVERAWIVVEKCYHFHVELMDLNIKSSADVAIFVLRAWKRRSENIHQSTGIPPVTPYYISALENLVGSHDAKKEEHNEYEVEPDSIHVPSTGIDMRWDQLLGYVDPQNAGTWDMFGSNAAEVPDYRTAAPGFGVNVMNINGWF